MLLLFLKNNREIVESDNNDSDCLMENMIIIMTIHMHIYIQTCLCTIFIFFLFMETVY